MLESRLRITKAALAMLGAAASISAGGAVKPAAFSAPSQHKIVAVGHRGTVKFAPENTIVAHEAAIALGARAIEFDVRFTRDSEAVVIHDATVDRTTNGSGRVENMTLAEIKTLDAGSWKGPEFSGEQVPTLREALRNIKGRAAVDIDFKGGPSDAGERLVKILDEEGYRDGPLVTVFARARHLNRLKAVSPHYALRPHFQSSAKTAALADELQINVMGLRRRSFSFSAADAITSRDIILFANVMGFADGPRGFEDSVRAGARFIQTDHLDKLVSYLQQRDLLETCVLGRDFKCYQPPNTQHPDDMKLAANKAP